MARCRILVFFLLVLAAGAFSAGCGGGETSSPQTQAAPGSASVLAWDPPASYEDNTSLDPYEDLDHYEVYVSENSSFADGDLPLAEVAAVSDIAPVDVTAPRQELVKEFVLENLGSFLVHGKRYYVSIKAVGSDGQKSGFMAPISWDLI